MHDPTVLEAASISATKNKQFHEPLPVDRHVSSTTVLLSGSYQLSRRTTRGTKESILEIQWFGPRIFINYGNANFSEDEPTLTCVLSNILPGFNSS